MFSFCPNCSKQHNILLHQSIWHGQVVSLFGCEDCGHAWPTSTKTEMKAEVKLDEEGGVTYTLTSASKLCPRCGKAGCPGAGREDYLTACDADR